MKKKEFIPPVAFELVLRHKKREALDEVATWLMSGGNSSFRWDVPRSGVINEYTLSIESSWDFNLNHIAKILLKYKEN